MKKIHKSSKAFQKATKTFLRMVNNFLKRNLKMFSRLILIPFPVIAFYLGSKRSFVNVIKIVALELLLILISCFLSYFSKELNGGINFPESRKRFTKEDEDGEVTIETKRLQEMILWVAEVEDWMERKGLR